MTSPASKRSRLAIAPFFLTLLCACGDGGEPAPPAAGDDATTNPSGLTPVERMYAESDAVLARPEHDATRVVVQNILIGVSNAGLPHLVRSQGEAEVLTAAVTDQLAQGADFDDLVREHSSDQYPGIYTLLSTGESEPNEQRYLRSELAQYFGDVAFRLEVGEIGVAPADLNMPGRQGKSPFGFHIIKRLE